MKGSAPRPPRPAARTANGSTTAEARRSPVVSDPGTPGEAPIDPSNEITLAVLEEISAARAKGYDPYNNSTAAHRPDAWDRKRKRD